MSEVILLFKQSRGRTN